MSRHSATPFDSIESSHEYVSLLAEAVALALTEIEGDIAQAGPGVTNRRKEALHLVAFKLDKLSSHMAASRRILNDLRTLRRLLFEERRLIATSGGAGIGPETPRERHFVAATE